MESKHQLTLTVDLLTDLELAFESSDAESSWYLDLERGEVFLVTGEIAGEFERIAEQAKERGLEFEQVVAESALPDWGKEAVLIAARVEEGMGDAIIPIGHDESHRAYRDMEDFVESIEGAAIQQRLLAALDGNRPFRRFKDALSAFPAEEQRWFAFRDARLRERLLEWLEDEGIEVTWTEPSSPA